MREITDSERFAWQHRAVNVLAALIARGPREGLKPVTWTVNAAGPTLYASMNDREVYEGWKRALGKPDSETEPWGDSARAGDTRVIATWERYDRKCRVTLALNVWSDEGAD